MTNNYEKIRPYLDEEANVTTVELLNSPFVIGALKYYFSEEEIEVLKQKIPTVNSVTKFQDTFIRPVVQNIIDNSTLGFTFSGLEHLQKNTKYLFISNHRDIAVDSCLFNYVLNDNEFVTAKVAIGNNLTFHPIITSIMRMNKCFIVRRDLTGREAYAYSKLLSQYIRDKITVTNDNVWIAQREGRAKDGNDKTQSGLLKMLAMSGDEDMATNFNELNIVTVSIAYEYDPCIAMKAKELTTPNYEKQPDDDYKSILTGITGFKGRVHLHFSKPLHFEELPVKGRKVIPHITKIIDNEIHKGYQLWPMNYIAYDRLHQTKRFEEHYTEEEKEAFQKYLNEQSTEKDIQDFIIKNYANPLINALECT